MILKYLLILFLYFPVAFYTQQTQQTLVKDKENLYDIQDSVMIKTREGAMISAMVVKKKDVLQPLPVIFQFTIYVRDTGRDLQSLKDAVQMKSFLMNLMPMILTM
jgi:hypothetical protein